MKKFSILLGTFVLFNLNIGFCQTHSALDSFLKTYVQDGWVGYKKIHEEWKNPEHPLKKYLKSLEKYLRKEVEAWPKNDQMAFYINAYNAYTIALILDHYPLKSIKDIGSPWKEEIVKLLGETHHLDWIEHDMLRGTFKDFRIHASIVCASKGCPKLQSFAFEGAKLDQQLTNVMREFVNNPQKNKFDSGKKAASLSKIFKWFSDDFKPSVKDFLMLYANEDTKKVLKDPDVTIDYLDYDWNLNGE